MQMRDLLEPHALDIVSPESVDLEAGLVVQNHILSLTNSILLQLDRNRKCVVTDVPREGCHVLFKCFVGSFHLISLASTKCYPGFWEVRIKQESVQRLTQEEGCDLM